MFTASHIQLNIYTNVDRRIKGPAVFSNGLLRFGQLPLFTFFATDDEWKKKQENQLPIDQTGLYVCMCVLCTWRAKILANYWKYWYIYIYFVDLRSRFRSQLIYGHWHRCHKSINSIDRIIWWTVQLKIICRNLQSK